MLVASVRGKFAGLAFALYGTGIVASLATTHTCNSKCRIGCGNAHFVEFA